MNRKTLNITIKLDACRSYLKSIYDRDCNDDKDIPKFIEALEIAEKYITMNESLKDCIKSSWKEQENIKN